MNRKVKIVLAYLLFGSLANRILSVIFRNTWFDDISMYFLIVIVLAMLFHFGKAIKNNQAQKKYFIYISLIVAQAIISRILIKLLNIDVVAWSWLIIVDFTIPLLTLFVMLLDIAKVMKPTNERLSFILQVIVVFCLIVFIPVSAILLLG